MKRPYRILFSQLCGNQGLGQHEKAFLEFQISLRNKMETSNKMP